MVHRFVPICQLNELNRLGKFNKTLQGLIFPLYPPFLGHTLVWGLCLTRIFTKPTSEKELWKFSSCFIFFFFWGGGGGGGGGAIYLHPPPHKIFFNFIYILAQKTHYFKTASPPFFRTLLLHFWIVGGRLEGHLWPNFKNLFNTFLTKSYILDAAYSLHDWAMSSDYGGVVCYTCSILQL